MGTFSKDNYATGSKAALVGGTTTLIEMCCPSRSDDPLEAIELWKSKAAGISSCDYTFHMGVTRFDDGTADALRAIVAEDGITSFKVFLAYKGAFGIDDTELYQTLSLAKELGVIVTAHCENADLVAETQKKLVAEGKTGPEWHEPSRPVTVEAEGCHHLMTFAELTGAEVYVVHTSCIPAVEAITAARKRGVKAWIETVAPYLTLDSSYAEQPDFEGAKYVMSPPLRSKEHGDFLWNASPTAPWTPSPPTTRRSISPRRSTWATRSKAVDANMQAHRQARELHPHPQRHPERRGARETALHRRRLPRPHRPADVRPLRQHAGREDLRPLSAQGRHRSRQRCGPRRSGIPSGRGKISATTHSMATDYSAFEGREIEGRAELVTVRGKVMVRDGAWCGETGWGNFLHREPKVLTCTPPRLPDRTRISPRSRRTSGRGPAGTSPRCGSAWPSASRPTPWPAASSATA